MNKQEAELKQAELLGEQTLKFCPLARKLCDMSCVCLTNRVEMARFAGKDEYTAVVRCDNPMFQYPSD